MSRRDTKVPVAVRQNDALLEFENFKKRFLFANKQITKQNCSLSMKIEELNAHISSLYVENLRLRASEISLYAQLKKEREKCFKSMADAEAAALNLLKRFGIIRETYNISSEPQSPEEPASPPQKTQKPPPRSPSAPRLAQLPSVPDIAEDPEPHEISSESEMRSNLQEASKLSQRVRNSAPRLPQPSRTSSPAAGITTDSSAEESTGSNKKRKLVRRPSGIIPASDLPVRPLSPVQSSTAEKDMNMSEEDEALALKNIEYYVSQKEGRVDEATVRKQKKKSRPRDNHEKESVVDKSEKSKNIKDGDEIVALRLKDVTNSPRRRRRRAPLATDHTDTGNEATQGKTTSSEVPNADQQIAARTDTDRGYLPTPAPSSASSTPVMATTSLPGVEEEKGAGGRERRSRKGVNYAEPKLNTKMRKPDPIPPPGAVRTLSVSIPSTTVSAALPTPLPSQDKTARQDTPINEEETASTEKSSRLSTGADNRRPHMGFHNTNLRRVVNSLPEDGDDDIDDDYGSETDEADADADSEFSDIRSWSNVSVRRKSGSHDLVKAHHKASYREAEAGSMRRHSNDV